MCVFSVASFQPLSPPVRGGISFTLIGLLQASLGKFRVAGPSWLALSLSYTHTHTHTHTSNH